MPGPGTEPGTLHFKAQYSTLCNVPGSIPGPGTYLFENIITVVDGWALQVKWDWDWLEIWK